MSSPGEVAYKVSFLGAILVLFYTTTCFGAGTCGANALVTELFFLPVLWLLWTLYVLSGHSVSYEKMILLWLAIDTAVLSVAVALTGGRSINGGEDIVFIVAYSPIIWPALLVARYLPLYSNVELVQHLGSSERALGQTILAWLTFSAIGGIYSVLLGGVVWGWRTLRADLRQK